MARIIGIDFGIKRCGIAVTDPLQIIVSGLTTVDTTILLEFMLDYCSKESVEKIVIGHPTHKDGNNTYLMEPIEKFAEEIRKKMPSLPIDFQDEAFTSFEAKKVIFASGIKKKKRQDKALVDKVSAVLILQKYLHHI